MSEYYPMKNWNYCRWTKFKVILSSYLSFKGLYDYRKLKDKNIGILITDHNVQETLSITDRAYLLFEGKILFQGTPEELAENKIVREKYLSNSFVLRRKDFQLKD